MKQDPFSGVYRALSPKELAEMFMNPNAPKTEAEHWAVREIEKQRAEIERLRAENERLTRECAAEWEPIETAPRDGTTILVYFRRHGPMTVVASDQDDPDADWRPWYIDDHKHGPYVVRGYRQGDDTHWMPLPKPPKALEGKP